MRVSLHLSALKKALLVGVVLLGAFSAWMAWGLSKWGTLRYVARQTGLELPIFPSNLYAHDNAETTVDVHLSLGREEVARLLRDRRFRSLQHDPYPMPFPYVSPSDFRDVAAWPREFRNLKAGAQAYHAGGCAQDTNWGGVLDAKSGSLWLEVNYPDLAGDRPGCLMDAVSGAEKLERLYGAPPDKKLQQTMPRGDRLDVR